jgi:hypothetical protein
MQYMHYASRVSCIVGIVNALMFCLVEVSFMQHSIYASASMQCHVRLLLRTFMADCGLAQLLLSMGDGKHVP